MRTVEDLLNELMQIKDKSKPVKIRTCWDQVVEVDDWEVYDWENCVEIGGDL